MEIRHGKGNESSTAMDGSSNDDKCLLCYGPHTGTGHQRGSDFEMKDLKLILTKSFGIQFLPHFNQFGRVHMCSKCHTEFLKVEAIYDEFIEVEKRFDSIREKFAFIVVDSIFKSDYISNYVHGNAFDAFRYLVFKEWSERFKKHSEFLKKINQQQQQQQQSQPPPQEQQLNGEQKQENIVTKDNITTTSRKIINNKASTIEKKEETQIISKSSSSKVVKADDVEQFLKEKTCTYSSSEELLNLLEDKPKKEVESTRVVRPAATKPAATVESKKLPLAVKSTPKVEEEEEGEEEVNNEDDESQVALPQKQRETGEKEKVVVNNPGKPIQNAIPAGKVTKKMVLSADGKKLLSTTGGTPLSGKHTVIFVKKDPSTGKMVQVSSPPLNGNALTSLINDHLKNKATVVKKSSTPTSSGKAATTTTTTPKANEKEITKEDDNDTIITPKKSLPDEVAKPQQHCPMPSVKKQVKVVQRPPRTIPSNSSTTEEKKTYPKIVSVTSVSKSSLKDLQIEMLTGKEEKESSVLAKEDGDEEKISSTTTITPVESSEMSTTTSSSNGTKDSSDSKTVKNNVAPEDSKILPNESTPPPTEPVTPVNDAKPPVTSPESRGDESRSGRRRLIKRIYDPSNWASGQEMDKLVTQYVKGGLKNNKNSPKRAKADPRQKSLEPEDPSTKQTKVSMSKRDHSTGKMIPTDEDDVDEPMV